MRLWGLMVGLLLATSGAAQACDGDSCEKLVVAAGKANPFDGNWSETVTGESPQCAGSFNTTFSIANGRLIQKGSSGRINPDGSAHGTGAGGGFTLTWTGHFSGNTASGRYKRNDGCLGRWEAVRQ